MIPLRNLFLQQCWHPFFLDVLKRHLKTCNSVRGMMCSPRKLHSLYIRSEFRPFLPCFEFTMGLVHVVMLLFSFNIPHVVVQPLAFLSKLLQYHQRFEQASRESKVTKKYISQKRETHLAKRSFSECECALGTGFSLFLVQQHSMVPQSLS